MIGRLTGIVADLSADGAIIDVGGVGYLVQMSARCLDRLGATGTKATLQIETVVRADAIKLYGFSSSEEKSWFRLLQEVQGVGAKVALGVLGVLAPQDLAAAVAAGDHAAVARAPGVGPKLAKRIVSELKDKVPAGFVAVPKKGSAPVAVEPGALTRADAVSALVNLGYGQQPAAAAVDAGIAALGPEAGVADLIRHGLKVLSEG